MSKTCRLCDLLVPKNPLREGDHLFCCAGCLTVFKIIGEQENFRDHPLFQEALRNKAISNPNLHPEKERDIALGEKLKWHMQISGMWCTSCADAISLIVKRYKGVVDCRVDYATDLAFIEYLPCEIGKEELKRYIQKLGYTANDLTDKENKQASRSLWFRFGVAVFSTLNIMMFSYPLYVAQFGLSTEGYEKTLGWLCFLLSLPLIFYSASPIWKRLLVSLKSRLFGMETLVFIGVSTAFTLSFDALIKGRLNSLYFDSMSMIITAVLLGNLLEKRAKFSAKETLYRLTRTLPKKGYKKMTDGEFRSVSIKEISPGDILAARRGEKIVLDGKVLEGSALVDETILTGEACLKSKKKGDVCIGGSLIKQGSLVFQVTEEAANSFLGKIVSILEKDLMHKSETDRLIDRITAYFIPAVLFFALLAGYFGGIERALTLLLIACPCAMGIAVPLAISRLLYGFARKGALVRNRKALTLLARDPFFVFDKTGTLTEGKFRLLRQTNQLTPIQQAVLKGLVSHSIHPASLAIFQSLHCRSVKVKEVQEIVGRGIEGGYKKKRYFLASERYCLEKGINVPTYPSTTSYFVEETTLLSEFHLGDKIRPRLPQIEGGILSGDSPKLVENVAKECGLLWGKGGLDPLQKRDEILDLKKSGRLVAMVGDGINDAPAMGAADVGISVVSGSDLAIEVSDILLTTEYLDALPELCALSKKGIKIIRQNIFWAFFYNVVGVLLASQGFLTPLFAAFAMVFSSLVVIFNSRRLS